jgi:hypothetical protein
MNTTVTVIPGGRGISGGCECNHDLDHAHGSASELSSERPRKYSVVAPLPAPSSERAA